MGALTWRSTLVLAACTVALAVAGAGIGATFSLARAMPAAPPSPSRIHVRLAAHPPPPRALDLLSPEARRAARALSTHEEAEAWLQARRPGERAAAATTTAVWARRASGGDAVFFAHLCDRAIFDLFGRGFVGGRAWTDAEERSLAPVVVLSQRAARELAGTVEAVGREVVVEGRALRVVGVLDVPPVAETLHDPLAFARPKDVYLPRPLGRSLGRPATTSRTRATEVADTLLFVDAPPGTSAGLEPIRSWAPEPVRFTDLDLSLLGVAALIALSLGAGVTRMLRADALGRLAELAMRRTAGASRAHLVRELGRVAIVVGTLSIPLAVGMGALLLALVRALAPFPASVPSLELSGLAVTSATCIGITLVAWLARGLVVLRALPSAHRWGSRPRRTPWGLLAIEVALLVGVSATLLAMYEPMRRSPLGPAGGSSAVVAVRGSSDVLRHRRPGIARMIGPEPGALQLHHVEGIERGVYAPLVEADPELLALRNLRLESGRAPARPDEIAVSRSLARRLPAPDGTLRLDGVPVRIVGVLSLDGALVWRGLPEALEMPERWGLAPGIVAGRALLDGAPEGEFVALLGEWNPIGVWRNGWVLLVPIALFLIAHALGVAGLVSQDLSQRGPELAVRMALGATPLDLSRLAVLRALRSAGLGAVAGAALGALLAHAASLGGVSIELRAWHLLVTAALFCLTSGLASWRDPRALATIAPLRST